ncbi:MAG: hypothetical protein KDM91_03865 [Verrucomicrobiae bacterium]|nr:hypothetical protein [Verrucomicrobiae bacterium]
MDSKNRKPNDFAGMDGLLAADTGNLRKRAVFRLLIGGTGMAVVGAITWWFLPRIDIRSFDTGGIRVFSLRVTPTSS